MQKLLLGFALLPFLASIASAGQPLSDQQMDGVIAAGWPLSLLGVQSCIGCQPMPLVNAQGQPIQPGGPCIGCQSLPPMPPSIFDLVRSGLPLVPGFYPF